MWFAEHRPEEYTDKKAYMNAFMQYVAEGKEGELRPIATVQTYVLAKYNEDVEPYGQGRICRMASSDEGMPDKRVRR